MPRKAFCIGFHKTGTTSLKRALEKLRYRVAGPNEYGKHKSYIARMPAGSRQLLLKVLS
jgi:hypothetical protein